MPKKTSLTTQEIDSLRRIDAALLDSWFLQPVPPSAEWCQDVLRLSPEIEAGSGPINLRERPYWKAVFDAFDDPSVESIVVKKSTQVGGTVTLWAHMLYKAVWSPAPSMVVLPDKESAIEFRDRVYWNARENSITESMVPRQRDWNTRYIDLNSMRVYLAWSGSAQKLRMRACQTVYLSEVDVFGTTPGSRGGDPNKAAQERTKSFYSRKIYRESSPTAEPSTIANEYEQTNKGTWRCPCPHCGLHQELRFFTYKIGELAGRGGITGYLDDHGQLASPEDAEKNARYVCKNGCVLTPLEVHQSVERGVYAAESQKVDITGRVIGKPPDSKSWGIHLWSIHSPTISIGQIAREYVLQKRSNHLSDFMTNWLGLEFSSRRRMPTWQQLGTRMAAEYERSEVWPKAHFITTGADCQEDRVKWVTIAYGHMCSMWVVDWGECWRDEEREASSGLLITDDLLQFWEQVVKRKWTVFGGKTNPFGRRAVFNRKIGIDSNHRTMDVHNLVKAINSRNVLALRGDHQVEPSEKYRPRLVERNTRTGEIYRGGLEQWGVYVNIFKDDLLRRFSAKAGEPGAFHLPRDVVSIGKDFLQELVNEPPTFVKNPKTGRGRTIYKPKSDSIPVDYWDSCVYSRAVAEMIVDSLPNRPGWDSAGWPAA